MRSAMRFISEKAVYFVFCCGVIIAMLFTPIRGLNFGSLATNNTQDVDLYKFVNLGSTEYRLPVKKYGIWVKPYDKRRDHAAFGFDALLPDVSPASDDPDDAKQWGTGTGWHRQVRVLVEYGRDFISQEQMLNNFLELSRGLKRVFEKDAREDSIYAKRSAEHAASINENYVTLSNGCKRYENLGIDTNLVQICKLGAQNILIGCDTKAPSPGCSVHINIADKTQLTYDYGFQYLDQAILIQEHISSLLRSFQHKT